jgi:hypothetical protein
MHDSAWAGQYLTVNLLLLPLTSSRMLGKASSSTPDAFYVSNASKSNYYSSL